MEKLLSLKEASEMLGRTPRTLRRWIKEGKLPAKKIPGRFGGEWRIPASAVTGIEAIEPVMVEPIEFTVCRGVRKDGHPCGAPAVAGTGYCRHHQDQADGEEGEQ